MIYNTLEELILAKYPNIIKVLYVCPECRGTGEDMYNTFSPCPLCHGETHVFSHYQELEIHESTF